MTLHVITVELENEADMENLLDLLNKWEQGASGVEEPEGSFNVSTTSHYTTEATDEKPVLN